MATTTAAPLQTSKTTQLAIAALRKLYPEELADKSFDNTGLLLESPSSVDRRKVLLTIDLTTAVAEEAVEKEVDLVVAYHPIIFRGLKSLTLKDTQQTSLLRLAANGISVYSPHTAVDAAVGGNAGWLADCVTGQLSADTPSQGQHTVKTEEVSHAGHRLDGSNMASPYTFSRFGPGVCSDRLTKLAHSRITIVPSTPEAKSGAGRLVTLAQASTASKLLSNLTITLGQPPAYKLALPYGLSVNDVKEVKRIALCAGSGGSVFSKIDEAFTGRVDMLITGEMSHHEALAAVEQGKIVVTLGHSDSERGYLRMVMQGVMQREIHNLDRHSSEMVEVEVLVSERDQDPFGTVFRSSYS